MGLIVYFHHMNMLFHNQVSMKLILDHLVVFFFFSFFFFNLTAFQSIHTISILCYDNLYNVYGYTIKSLYKRSHG